MKKFISVILVICFIMVLASCSQSNVEEPDLPSEEVYQPEIVEPEIEEDEQEEQQLDVESLPDPVMINADFDVVTNPDGTFDIHTNLPSETELSLTLKGRGYIAQGKAIVYDGVGVSERFTNKGKQLFGDFTLEVLMPIPSVQTDYVKHFIGENGEYLTGPYLKGALGSVVVSKEFKVSFTQNATEQTKTSEDFETNKDAEPERKTIDGIVCYRTPYGEKYHFDPECGGKNSYETSSISGLTACSKCAK